MFELVEIIDFRNIDCNLQTMPKRRGIFLCSVLKPIDEPRMLERMALSIVKGTNEPIYLFGQKPSADLPNSALLTYFPQDSFNRLSIKRLLIHLKIFIKLLKVKPKVIIPNTHEILLVIIVYKILFGGKVIYDIQENYYKNIRYSEAFIKPLRLLIAEYVRIKEVTLAPLIDHFILAESCYAQELKFIKARFTILENKYSSRVNTTIKRNTTGLKFLFSGTLAQETGVFECIELITKLQQIKTDITLVIIGHTPKTAVLNRLQREFESKHFISLIGGSKPVSHSAIVEAILNANIGILAYEEREHTKNRIPTKLFEYQALGLPILSQANRTWNDELIKNNSLITDLASCNPQQLLQECQKLNSQPGQPVETSFWRLEEELFNNLIINTIT